MGRSLLLRLTLVLAVSGLVAFLVGRTAMHDALRENLYAEFDAGLLARAQSLGPLVEAEHGGFEFDLAPAGMPAFSRAEEPEYFQVWIGGGTPLARSPSLGTADLPHRVVPGGEPSFFDAVAPDGRPLRCVGLRVPASVEHDEPDEPDEHDEDDEYEDEAQDEDGRPNAPDGGEVEQGGRELLSPADLAHPLAAVPMADVVVAVGRATVAARVASVQRVVDRSLLVLGLVLVGASLLGIWFTRRSLRLMTDALEARDARALGPVEWRPPPPRELQPLTEALDKALAQAGAAVERERRVMSGMAHELRTPVAEILTTAEVALDGPEDLGPARAPTEAVRDTALQMKEIVETMLRVARGQMPDDPGRLSRVDPAALWRDVWQASANGAPLTMDLRQEEADEVRCDAAALRIVLSTLADNAARYAPPDSNVQADVSAVRGGCLITVTNAAPHLEAGDLAHLVEPLWSKAPGRRTRTAAGSGLGLYLAREVARYASLDLQLALESGRLRASIRVPAASEDPESTLPS